MGKKSDDGYYFAMGYFNFHEGAGVFAFSDVKPRNEHGDSYNLIWKDDKGKKDEIVAVLHRRHQERLKWQGAVFLHVLPSLKHFINQSVISGIYRNSQGNKFVFEDSGKAIWPDHTLEYEIGLDFVNQPGNCNYLFIPLKKGREPKAYGFKWQADKLLLYESEACIGDPLHILVPSRK